MFTPVQADRREAVRHPIDLSIEIESYGVRAAGRTLDFSVDGVCVQLPTGAALQPGDILSFVVLLEHLLPGSPLQLSGQAIVTRVDKTVAHTIVAFRTNLLTSVPVQGASSPRPVFPKDLQCG